MTTVGKIYICRQQIYLLFMAIPILSSIEMQNNRCVLHLIFINFSKIGTSSN